MKCVQGLMWGPSVHVIHSLLKWVKQNIQTENSKHFLGSKCINLKPSNACCWPSTVSSLLPELAVVEAAHQIPWSQDSHPAPPRALTEELVHDEAPQLGFDSWKVHKSYGTLWTPLWLTLLSRNHTHRYSKDSLSALLPTVMFAWWVSGWPVSVGHTLDRASCLVSWSEFRSGRNYCVHSFLWDVLS